MGYDENGLGISELVFLAVNYPETYKLMQDLDEIEAMKLARKYIKAYNLQLIEK